MSNESSSHHAGSGSGLKLILPSLKSVQALKGKGKAKLTPVKEKIPRPIKLKPLKEVLSRLIVQIKKKDDYAFFLNPVDLQQVQGYTDVVKRPMDFGTMTTKVERGRYRTLEDFANDVRLVTTNAKTFNPPGSIFYTEADKIEAWALDHISKAASTVIEYETDWNVEIERDDDPLADDDEEGAANKGTPMDVDEGGSARARSPSVSSLQTPTQGNVPGPSRRAARGGTGKKQPGMLSETLEPGGGLPGAKDGLGAFPPGSDWAERMLALKLKGKRYRTKKERMRMERGGPPFHADGSLDYPEMEDPFSVLSIFVPEPLSRPLLTPLFPPLVQQNSAQPPFPGPVNIPPATMPPVLVSLLSPKPSSSKKRSKRRHWTVIRNAPSRGRARERDEEEPAPAWKTPREIGPTDYGAFATLLTVLAQEKRAQEVGTALGSEERVFQAVRESVEERPTVPAAPAQSTAADFAAATQQQYAQYWEGKGREAEEYLRDVVYGGVDGLAYVRSLAEFVSPPEPLEDLEDGDDTPAVPALGMPLALWVEENLIAPLTDGRHQILTTTARQLHRPSPATDPAISAQIDLSLVAYPAAALQLVALQQFTRTQLDMAALIKVPAELFLADDVWAGADFVAARRRRVEEAHDRALAESPELNAAGYLQFAIDEHREAEGAGDEKPEDPDMLKHALEYSAEMLTELGQKRCRDGTVKTEGGTASASVDEEQDEEPTLKKVRLNLLALAKRAPLDQVARIPAALVPEYLRTVVPTI